MSFVRWEQKGEDICQTRGEVKEYSREKKRWDFKREREEMRVSERRIMEKLRCVEKNKKHKTK